MFTSARIKLTLWYLLIITLISVCFSIFVYQILNGELDRVQRLQRYRTERELPQELAPLYRPPIIDQELVSETQERLKAILVLINLGIIGISAVAGYFLAGRTLNPIKEMVEDQHRFITDASHELRTPITVLKSEIEVSLREKSLNSSEIRQILESNLEEVNSLQFLSDNLIKLTQYEKNNGAIFDKVSLMEVVNEAQKKVLILAKNKHISINNSVKDLGLWGDRQSLVELFVIFLDNAIKYSAEKTKIDISSRKTDGHVTISVKDQGAGIAKEEIPHLFDRFYRGDKSRTKTEVSGYGLGLSIAKEIVKKHGGSIKVESELEKGTTFSIHLPVK